MILANFRKLERKTWKAKLLKSPDRWTWVRLVKGGGWDESLIQHPGCPTAPGHSGPAGHTWTELAFAMVTALAEVRLDGSNRTAWWGKCGGGGERATIVLEKECIIEEGFPNLYTYGRPCVPLENACF